MTKHVETPEHLPPGKVVCTPSANLAALERAIRREFQHIDGMKMEHRTRSMRIGLLLNEAKEEHKSEGDFLSWMAEVIPEYGRRQLYYFMSMAAVFVQEKNLGAPKIKLLCLPEPGATAKVHEVEAVVSDWFGDRTVADVLEDYNIKPSNKKGGKRPGSGRPKATDADEGEDNKQFWLAHMRDIQVAGLVEDKESQTWRTLPKHQRKKLLELNIEFNHLIKESLSQ